MNREFYFIGVESRIAKDNRFADLDTALKLAAHAAQKNLMPTRVYKMWPNRSYTLVKMVHPDEALEILKDDINMSEIIRLTEG